MLGIDISKWNGVFDWSKSVSKGVELAYLKASGCGTGGNYVDYRWEDNSKTCPLKYRGAYHYFDYRGVYSGEYQCKFFLDTVGSFGNLKGVLDIEDNSGGGWAKLSSMYGTALKHALQWVNTYLKETGVLPVLYLNSGLTILKDSLTKYTFRNFTQCPLWVANYNKISVPPIGAWSSYAMWQYSSTGDGVGYGNGAGNMYIDLNTVKDLSALLVKPETTTEDEVTVPTVLTLEQRVKRLEEMHNI